MPSRLILLPPEVLDIVVSHFDAAKTLYKLSLTCRQLYDYTNEDGFRSFVLANFPSIQTPNHWREAAWSLTTTSKAWDEKSFVARAISPHPPNASTSAMRLLGFPTHRPGFQSMGFQPVIDCVQERNGGRWNSRTEILAIGAGSELHLQSRSLGTKDEESDSVGWDGQEFQLLNQEAQREHWISWKPNGYAEGADDITAICLFQPSQRPASDENHIVLGRASGKLEHVVVKNDGEISSNPYNNPSRLGIQSATISTGKRPLIAACLLNETVAIYPATAAANTEPFGKISVAAPVTQSQSRAWKARFLNDTCLAIGSGPSTQPLCLYDARPDEVSETPARTFFTPASSEDDNSRSGLSSVYSITPISQSSQAGGAPGELFLSGWFSGEVRLHDRRSPDPEVAVYDDPVDVGSAIYSLLSYGRERFVAGGARHSLLKIFDLRMPGGKVYYASNASPCFGGITKPSTNSECCTYHRSSIQRKKGYNLYLRDESSRNHQFGPPSTFAHRRRIPIGSVYALTSASSYSPTFYAGIEDSIIQIDLADTMDKHPDPTFKSPFPSPYPKDVAVRKCWDPDQKVLRLSQVAHTTEGRMELLTQRVVGANSSVERGLDSRWAPQVPVGAMAVVDHSRVTDTPLRRRGGRRTNPFLARDGHRFR